MFLSKQYCSIVFAYVQSKMVNKTWFMHSIGEVSNIYNFIRSTKFSNVTISNFQLFCRTNSTLTRRGSRCTQTCCHLTRHLHPCLSHPESESNLPSLTPLPPAAPLEKSSCRRYSAISPGCSTRHLLLRPRVTLNGNNPLSLTLLHQLLL